MKKKNKQMSGTGSGKPLITTCSGLRSFASSIYPLIKQCAKFWHLDFAYSWNLNENNGLWGLVSNTIWITNQWWL